MTSWGKLQEYARSVYDLSEDEEDHFTLIFEYDTRSQKILVRTFTGFEQEFIEFRTTVCQEADMDPMVALKINAELPIGALALDNGLYILVYKFPLTNLDIEEFELPLNALATTGDSLEELYSSKEDTY